MEEGNEWISIDNMVEFEERENEGGTIVFQSELSSGYKIYLGT